MSNEILLAIIGGVITITVALISIVPKIKELELKNKHDLLIEKER